MAWPWLWGRPLWPRDYRTSPPGSCVVGDATVSLVSVDLCSVPDASPTPIATSSPLQASPIGVWSPTCSTEEGRDTTRETQHGSSCRRFRIIAPWWRGESNYSLRQSLCLCLTMGVWRAVCRGLSPTRCSTSSSVTSTASTSERQTLVENWTNTWLIGGSTSCVVSTSPLVLSMEVMRTTVGHGWIRWGRRIRLGRKDVQHHLVTAPTSRSSGYCGRRWDG
mmetsp:Transcript_65378/g.154461  ORF Transcript_65378/g.154461 Transcript_65378/m.154461 type:complete len:221 (-) Transcript_65378:122-784(-)